MTGSRPRVEIFGLQRDGTIRGKTAPFASIEAVNVSASAGERVRPCESLVIARANEGGRFSGRLAVRPNDLVRVRARTRSGAGGPWTAFRARGIQGSPRPLRVAVFRIGLRDLENGRIRIFNLMPSRPIAEPGAELTIENTRTGERVRLCIDERSTIPARVTIAGRAGDSLRVEGGGREVGTVVTPPPRPPRDRLRPGALHQELGFVPAAKRFDVPLFARRPCPFDVLQSELQNCYLASAAAAIAHARPDALERAIADLGDGRYRVRFKIGRAYRPHDVVVTSDLYVRPSGELLYGSSAGSLWWPILEKAFAALRGSYRKVGRGGTSHRVFELLLGRPPRHFFVVPATPPESVWGELGDALDQRRPVVAGTSPPWTAKKFRHTGLVPDHAYAVLGLRGSGSRRVITVRNPWGEDVPAPAPVRRRGAIDVGLDEFMRLFQVISTVR